TRTGWFDPRYGEIGDIASGYFGVLQNYLVQAVWSQADGGVVIPFDVTFLNRHGTGTQLLASGAKVQATAPGFGDVLLGQSPVNGGTAQARAATFTTPSVL